jgi:hypothetical protein
MSGIVKEFAHSAKSFVCHENIKYGLKLAEVENFFLLLYCLLESLLAHIYVTMQGILTSTKLPCCLFGENCIVLEM